MFVVEIGAVITTIGWLIQAFGGEPLGGGNEPAWFAFTVALWLWLTVVFANLAEALAEGRGKAQADALRATRTETVARLKDGGERPAAELQPGDVVVVEAGELIPGDGTVIEGIASVDESAITGESAPVIREAGGDRSAVTGGTRVLSDRIVVEITQEPGKSFLDRMIALVEGAERRKTPNEIALNILLSGLTIIFLVAVVTLRPFAEFSGTDASVATLIALLVALIPTTIGALLSAIGIAGHGPPGPAQRAGAVGPRGRGLGRRRHAAAGQDRHDHARQPRGDRVHADAGRQQRGAGRGRAARLDRGRDARGALDRGAGEAVRRSASTTWPRTSRASCPSAPRPG